MARLYGWTIETIDGLTEGQRDRVRYWWAVRSITADADRHLREWRKANAGTVNTLTNVFRWQPPGDAS